MRLSETDFALVDALQDEVRQPWSELARQLGRSAVTVRRRWQRLESAGAAWFSTYPGPRSGAVFAVVEVVCEPDEVTNLAKRLAQHPKIMTISEVTGDIELLCWVVAEDMTVLRDIIRHGIGSAPGVRAVRDAPVLNRALRERVLTQRVDLASDGSLYTHAMALHLSVPLEDLDRVAHRISRLSATRLCAAVAGERHNLHVVMWLRLGHLFDEAGVRTGFISWTAPAPAGDRGLAPGARAEPEPGPVV
ncbi:Lrp/AsnC family transcriptional regulator [Nesterenkonia flava]|uniref:Lrp/AsnC family transcriptional regulator n=1 Tax=Nesterenkonia flava TaxID=469799 RepID=A0ABU1FSL7_9MICC|nr:Lrp/AsnC family transcriptional regulator [Nesterenkonia flava]MDR5711645.1 Lrp/AsnC family transcriptional regulator [Nesterenkonia flava]